jgi:hypothetical protein
MASKTVKLILPVLLALTNLTGCQDSIHIEDRDICTAVIVDKDDDQYAFYVEVAGISSRIQNPHSRAVSSRLPPSSGAEGKRMPGRAPTWTGS